ncbi:MAG: hypothetical protein H0V72_18905, partial [Bradyrhizobium sp.]|nr:hypothetical protein [Bradyrhizobium sp.]
SALVPASAAQRKANRAAAWGPMFKSQVERCWKKPNGGDATVEAAFTIRLTRDGLLAEQPVAEKPATSDYDKAYHESAVKALNACQPYKLPIEYFDEWKFFVPLFSERNRKAADDLFNTRSPSICRGC